ncbi:TIGR04255 family protein [Halomonas sp. BC04]|uniref:TIGR04255 family protein n=1 Tax=Halomonas sp. BC04 TaxID=1403540 RepID=UPI0009DF95EF|nr:TIGR04255 family protein [Halomonas sp. BC04]
MPASMRLSQAPLIHVVAQVHFSEVPPYEEAALNQLHRSLMSAGYPERLNGHLEEVEWSFEMSDGASPKQRKRRFPRFVFKGPGQRRLVELRHNCLIFKVTDYSGHQTFLSEWNEVMGLVSSVIPEMTNALLHSLSLRYVDLVVPKERETLRELVSVALLPPPLPDVDGNALFGSTLKAFDTGDGRHLRVTFEEIQPQRQRLTKILPDDLIEQVPEFGLSIDGLPHWQVVHGAYGLLDIDHVYTASNTPAVGDCEMPDIFRKLHEQTHKAFWGLISQQAIESWE